MKYEIQFTGDLNRIAKHGSSEMILSNITQFESTKKELAGYAIKYVFSGTERYIAGGKHFQVSDGQYLLLNKKQIYECNFQSEKQVNGFCITLDEQMLSGVYNVLSRPEGMLLDNAMEQFSPFPGLHELVYTRGNALGSFIHRLYGQILAGAGPVTSGEIFYQISVALLKEQVEVAGKMSKIKAIKGSTKKELYARLEIARELLEECNGTTLKIDTVAREAALSEYHFFRSFKMVYGISPHQFYLRKKIQRAAALIAKGEHSLTEIAYLTGFPDIQSFSRAFRRHMFMSPSNWNLINLDRFPVQEKGADPKIKPAL
ncbi:MAG TPA: AraC family transcriptional regulator [Chitinophagaceae bacterium]|nr:AraC family transcriptional regulator [Chitinophagaceae bacterium]